MRTLGILAAVAVTYVVVVAVLWRGAVRAIYGCNDE